MTGQVSWRSRLRQLEQRSVEALRSPRARVVGTVVGLLALLAVGRRVLEADLSLVAVATDAGVVGGVVLAAAFAVFHGAAIATLRALGAPGAAFVWGSAQLIKYVPVPGSALAGMTGAAVQGGSGGRDAVRLVVVSSLLRMAAAVPVGILVLPAWWTLPTAADLALLALAAVIGVAVAVCLGGWVPTAWAVLGWGAAGTAIGVVLGPEAPVAVGAAYVLSWVAGQVAVPVPAGLGVRELAFVTLLTPTLGAERAAVLAVASRLVQTLADVVAATAVITHRRIRGDAPSPTGGPDGSRSERDTASTGAIGDGTPTGRVYHEGVDRDDEARP